MAKVRVKPWEANAVVSHPETEQFVNPDRSIYYDTTDPLVKAHPWLFATDAEIAAEYDRHDEPVTEVQVAAPKSRGRGRRL